MTCQRVGINGQVMIACSTRSRRRCECGRAATLLCDWKRPGKRSGTCDAGLCQRCTIKPTADKDLCSLHAAEFERWKVSRRLDSAGDRQQSGPPGGRESR